MAGVSISIDIRDAEVLRMLALIESRLTSMRPAMEEIGEIGTESILRNFEEHRSPEGIPWSAVAPSYAQYKAKHGRNASDILIWKGMSGGLMGSIHPQAGDSSVAIGTGPHIVYAAVHQFGAHFSKLHSTPRTLAFDDNGLFMSRKKAGRRKKKAVKVAFVETGRGAEIYVPERPYMGVRPGDWPKFSSALSRYIMGGL